MYVLCVGFEYNVFISCLKNQDLRFSHTSERDNDVSFQTGDRFTSWEVKLRARVHIVNRAQSPLPLGTASIPRSHCQWVRTDERTRSSWLTSCQVRQVAGKSHRVILLLGDVIMVVTQTLAKKGTAITS